MDFFTYWPTSGTSLLSAATAQPRPPHELAHASKPTLSMAFPITLVLNDGHYIGTMLGEVNALDRGWPKTLFSRDASGAIFLRHRPPPYTTVTEPARTPAATESKTTETQPKTTRYRKRRSSQGWIAMSDKSHGPSPASQTSLYVFALSERFRGWFLSCSYEQFCATMIGKGGMAVEGQPAKLMGMSVEQQHACAQQGFWGRSRGEASRNKQGKTGPPLPRQHEPRLTRGAYSFLVILVVLFHTTLWSWLMCCFCVCVSSGTYSSV